LQANKTRKSITKLTLVPTGLSFLWKKLYSWCQFRKSISLRCCDPWFLSGTKPHHVAMASETLSLKRVFSPPLHPEKHWYALNSPLCCSKPAFCSTSTLYWLAKAEMANKKFLLLFTLLQMLGLENMTHFHHCSAGSTIEIFLALKQSTEAESG